MSLQRVRDALKGTRLESAVQPLPSTGATVELAAKAIGCDPDQVAKTLSFLVGEQPILIVVSGNSRIDNKKYKAQFNKKAKMIPFEQVEELTGHAPGGVNPFGVNADVEVYLDSSLEKHELFYPAAGDENYYIVDVTKRDFETLSENFKGYVDVTR